MKDNRKKRPAYPDAGNMAQSRRTSKPSQRSGALNFKGERAPNVDIARIIEPTGKRTLGKLPELLAPAGSMQALRAAIAGGADAVYFGGGDFNARINAKNFTNEEIKEAIGLLHACGRKAYITLNTLVHGRETEEHLRFAEFVYLAGADALIVADLGSAAAIHRHLPHLELHASTQMSGHNLAQAELLSNLGFSRMVVARETSREDLKYLVHNSPIEIEMFVHGALCVCHSGQCLFSSIVGGRSGNRGECAQPCRLPYRGENGEDFYPLSLKDLSYASHVTDLIDWGVSSLKIEGRMKSPEYVFGVVRAFRTLLDEGRNATPAELSELAKIFSRGGFTDAYYTKKTDSDMLGIRSEEQKHLSRISLTSSEKIDAASPRRLKISAFAQIVFGEASSLRLDCGDISVTAYGPIPAKAINAPLTAENIQKNLTKFGATRFELEEYVALTDDDIILPVSALNALRREACTLLEEKLAQSKEDVRTGYEKYVALSPKGKKKAQRSARFYHSEQITDRARDYFDIIYLPLDRFSGECEGVILPPVIFDSEKAKAEAMLSRAKKTGAKYALVGNLGALELAEKYGFEIHGDFRFNVYNSESVAALESLGVKNVILSPELTLPQMRDVEGDTSAIVYGRIPLMLLEKCVTKELGSCAECRADKLTLTDRRGISFPTLHEFEHRNVIYNSAPTYMADRESDLARANIINRHFVFSTESNSEVDAVIDAHINGTPPAEGQKIRRI